MSEGCGRSLGYSASKNKTSPTIVSLPEEGLQGAGKVHESVAHQEEHAVQERDGLIGFSSLLNKCSDRSMEVLLPALLGNYDRPTDQPTDRRGHRGKFHFTIFKVQNQNLM